MSRIFEFERDRAVGEAHRRQLEAAFLQHGVAIVGDGRRPSGIRESRVGDTASGAPNGPAASGSIAAVADKRVDVPERRGSDEAEP